MDLHRQFRFTDLGKIARGTGKLIVAIIVADHLPFKLGIGDEIARVDGVVNCVPFFDCFSPFCFEIAAMSTQRQVRVLKGLRLPLIVKN